MLTPRLDISARVYTTPAPVPLAFFLKFRDWSLHPAALLTSRPLTYAGDQNCGPRQQCCSSLRGLRFPLLTLWSISGWPTDDNHQPLCYRHVVYLTFTPWLVFRESLSLDAVLGSVTPIYETSSNLQPELGQLWPEQYRCELNSVYRYLWTLWPGLQHKWYRHGPRPTSRSNVDRSIRVADLFQHFFWFKSSYSHSRFILQRIVPAPSEQSQAREMRFRKRVVEWNTRWSACRPQDVWQFSLFLEELWVKSTCQVLCIVTQDRTSREGRTRNCAAKILCCITCWDS